MDLKLPQAGNKLRLYILVHYYFNNNFDGYYTTQHYTSRDAEINNLVIMMYQTKFQLAKTS